MSDPSNKPWSSNPNAPQIKYLAYLGEKEYFTGVLIGAIFYGIAVVLFFQCMGTLLGPANRTRGAVKWGLVAHTIAMFSSVTVYTGISLDIHSYSYIDIREFPNGPLLYQLTGTPVWANAVPSVAFSLNQWLADGLLLYRCYIIYAMNYWIIAFPCLVYLASIAMGITFTSLTLLPGWITSHITAAVNIGISYFSISFSLNMLLTLMIAVRLILHSRNIQKATGTPTKASGLYKVIVTMLIESAALYAVAFIPYIVSWGAKNGVQYIFFPILTGAQVIGPFLITLRVASRRALTSETMVSEHIGSIRFRSQTSTGGNLTLLDHHPTTLTDNSEGSTPGGPGFVTETTMVDSHS